MKKENIKKICITGLLVVIALLSFFVLSKKMSDVTTYASIIETLDEKKNTVLGLTASSSAIANAISFIPNDGGTPLANQFTSLSSWLVLVLIVLYLEKYLLTIIGLVVFKYIIPIVCILLAVNMFIKVTGLNRLLMKVLLVAVVLLATVPLSTNVTRLIDQTYEESIKNKIENVMNVDIESDEKVEEIVEEEKSETGSFFESVGNFFSNAIGTVAETVEKTGEAISGASTKLITRAKLLLNNFIEATVVMIVTSCIIPLLTLMLLLLFIKSLSGIDISMPRISVPTIKQMVKSKE